MRKMTVLGASVLLAAGFLAAPAAAFASPADSVVQVLSDGHSAESVPAGQPDGVTARDDEPDATGNSSAIGFALIATALVGGGVTLTVLRRKGALGS